MGRCSALRCPNSTTRKCRTFRFPRDPERRIKWIKACRRDFTPTTSSFLCEKHFAYESFENRRADGLRKLKPNAVPTIFDFPEPVNQIKNDRLNSYDRILHQLEKINSRDRVEEIIEKQSVQTDKDADSIRYTSQHSLSLTGEDIQQKSITFDNTEDIESLDVIENDEFGSICHICGGQQAESVRVFDDDGLEHDLPAKIRQHLYTVDISNWKTTSKVCYQCISVLNSWHELFTICENVNRKSGLLLSVADHEESQNVEVRVRKWNRQSDSSVVRESEKESKNHSLLDFIRIVSEDENNDATGQLSSDEDGSLCGNAPSITADNPADLKYDWSHVSENKVVKTSEELSSPSSTAKKKRRKSNPNMLPPICHICHKTFSCTLTKRMHLRSVHITDRPYLCHLCERTFKRRDHLNGHIRHVHENEGKKMSYQKRMLCPDCGKILSSNTYKAHAENVHGKHTKDYECNLCDRKFGSYTDCYKHRMKHKKNLVFRDDKNFLKSCPYCFLEFENEYYYVKHLCRHEEITECEVCGIKFDAHEDFNKHVQEIHIGEKTVECGMCGKKFSSKMNLRNHIKTHMNVKRYECSYCNWKFMKNGQLKVHLYRHTGEHPHTCEFCGRGFRQKSDFKRHRAAHLQKQKKVAESTNTITSIVQECAEVTAQ